MHLRVFPEKLFYYLSTLQSLRLLYLIDAVHETHFIAGLNSCVIYFWATSRMAGLVPIVRNTEQNNTIGI